MTIAPATSSAMPAAPPKRPAAAETLRLYAGDWANFLDWCRASGLSSLPAASETIAAYLQGPGAGLSHGTLARRVAAIAGEHRRRGLPLPTTDPTIRAILRAARAVRQPRRARAPTVPHLARMAVTCSGDLAGQRDRALLLLAASGFGAERARRLRPGGAAATVVRAALLGLDAEDIRFTEAGMEIVLRPGPEDAEVHRVQVGRDTIRIHCPVQAMEDWLRASDSRYGPVFRKVDRWGNVEHRRLGTDAIRRILARRARPGR